MVIVHLGFLYRCHNLVFWSAINDLIGKTFKPKWILEWLDVVRLVPFSGTKKLVYHAQAQGQARGY